MKRFLNTILTLFLGIVFIISGLLKIDDPMGTAIKLEEYFYVFAEDVPLLESLFLGLKNWALFFSFIFSTAEVVLGVAILVNYKRKLTLKLTLLLLIFFGFLTFYSAYFNKVTDCGCFGDAIKFSPWGSFTKDLILLVAAIILYFTSNYRTSSNRSKLPLVAGIISVSIGLYAIYDLPLVDFRPYKVGNNLKEMLHPSVPCQQEYVMEKDGKEYVFEKYPTTGEYTFKESKVLNEEECMSKIPDFYISTENGDDITEEVFKGNKLLLIVHDLSKFQKEEKDQLVQYIQSFQSEKSDLLVITSDAHNFEKMTEDRQAIIQYYYADATVLKAMIRANPGGLFLQEGIVKQKWHYRNIPTAEALDLLIDKE